MNLTKERGMTLIEVLIAMAITSLLGLGIVSLEYILGKNQLLIINSYKSVDDANSSVTSFIREIRAARDSDNGAYLLEKVDNKEIIFYSDIDYDKSVEKVRYSLSGTNFIKGIIEPFGYPVQYPEDQEKLTTLTTNVRNELIPIFYYYNSDWPQDTLNNPLPQNLRLSDTRIVKIYLVINTQTNDPKANYTLESFSQIRMLKDNL
jgi:prepilin-type N-terminal cleavage/methylation domain-containing protein